MKGPAKSRNIWFGLESQVDTNCFPNTCIFVAKQRKKDWGQFLRFLNCPKCFHGIPAYLGGIV